MEEESFNLLHSLTAPPPPQRKKEEKRDLFLLSQFREREIASWVGPTKKGIVVALLGIIWPKLRLTIDQ